MGGAPVEDFPLLRGVFRAGFAGVAESGRPLPAPETQHHQADKRRAREEGGRAKYECPVHEALLAGRGTRVPMPRSRSAKAMRKSDT